MFRRILPLFVMVLLLPLLNACGGSPAAVPTAQSGTNSTAKSSNAAPTAVAVAPIDRPAATSYAAAAPTAAAGPPSLREAAPILPLATAAAAAEGEGSTGAADVGGSTTLAAPPPRRVQGQVAPLKAGETNDNEQFQSYLDYVNSYQGEGARFTKLGERYVITVMNNQQRPIYDARVRIFAGSDQIFEGLTYAGGKTIFQPDVLGISDNNQRLRLRVERGNSVVEQAFVRGQATSLTVVLPDAQSPDQLRLDLLFLLDTTGSMGDELGRIQETIDSIAQRIDAFQPRPVIRYGLVAYRDVGDAYVAREYDFMNDLPTFRQLLGSLNADGGGDTPEAIDEALQATMNNLTWGSDAIRLTFLVGDAGPHVPGSSPYTYLNGARDAVAHGIKIYPIAASNTDPAAEFAFRQLAQQTLGSFIFLTYQTGQSGGAPGESTTLEAGQQQYTVDRLDDLIVQVVQRELAAAVAR